MAFYTQKISSIGGVKAMAEKGSILLAVSLAFILFMSLANGDITIHSGDRIQKAIVLLPQERPYWFLAAATMRAWWWTNRSSSGG